MNTRPEAMPNPPLDTPVTAPTVITPARLLYWSVRRELWENRSIYLAPAAVAAVFLFGFLISTVKLAEKLRAASALSPEQQHGLIAQPFTVAAGLIMVTTFVVGVFYCFDALYSERRDRSILFWKSLPVSDLTTVLAKASIPIVVLPVLTFVIIFVTHCIMMLLSAAVLLASGQSAAPLWTHVSVFQMSLTLSYHFLTSHVLWYAPVYGYLLMVSAWARRFPALWAVLPLVAINVIEKVAFNTSYFAALIGSRFMGGPDGAFTSSGMVMNPMTELTPGQFFTSPGLWTGLALAAVFLFTAARLRRYREPI